ncbi:MAG: DUF1049 domain-containing protein [Methylobacterium mesophilicum]|nr:DUF1049 domain-containing protein [Methylobacterium mesophilicum]
MLIHRIVLVVILVPLAVLLVTLAVANRELVSFTLDPFNPGSAGLTMTLPFFVWLFLALGLGLLIGSTATWLRQGHYRRLARNRGREAETLRREQAANAAAMAQPGTTLPATTTGRSGLPAA